MTRVSNLCIYQLLLMLIVGFGPSRQAVGQTTRRSPSELLRILAEEPTQLQNSSPRILVFSCGVTAKDEESDEAARSLVEVGSSALPQIEEALESIRRDGQESRYTGRNANRIVYAYAQIAGRSALTRLQELMGDPKIAFLRHTLGNAVAVSLGLTSYVDIREEQVLTACRVSEPRDPLDQFILAWQQDDRSNLEATLTPDTRTALASLLQSRTWASIRSHFWHNDVGNHAAVGYRFDGTGRWSEPDETLDRNRESSDRRSTNSRSPELSAVFRNKDGVVCGTRRLTFYQSAEEGQPPLYLLSEMDLGGLLEIIGSCSWTASK